jgi:phosphate uptake regulator
MKNADIHQYIQSLRLHLLHMSRVSQRAVDYSIKAFSLGSAEACTNVRDAADEINIFHRKIAEISSDLLLMELPVESDLRFALSAARIGNALLSVYIHASEIATNSIHLQKNGRTAGYVGLTRMGDVVNSLMRLCVVALFDEEVKQAETVLHHRGEARLFELAFYDWYRGIDRRLGTKASCELAIANGISQMAKQTQEIAEAVLFWLEGTEDEPVTDIICELEFELRKQKAVTIPDGMEHFLLSIDACFANASLWCRFVGDQYPRS